MDSSAYLQSYGWIVGQGLRQGSLEKPLLVKHKKDQKGLGHDADLHEAWWERVFDGQLKQLDVTRATGDVTFDQKRYQASAEPRSQSPLYKMFVPGGFLEGSVERPADAKATPEAKKPKISKDKTKDKLKEKSKKSKKSEESNKVKESAVKKKKAKRKSKTEPSSKEHQWMTQLVKNITA